MAAIFSKSSVASSSITSIASSTVTMPTRRSSRVHHGQREEVVLLQQPGHGLLLVRPGGSTEMTSVLHHVADELVVLRPAAGCRTVTTPSSLRRASIT